MSLSPFQWLDIFATLTTLAILWSIHHFHVRSDNKRVWKCYRYFGGGQMVTPRKMSLIEATEWLGDSGVEVSHVDMEYGFIFYRPRGS